MKRISSLSLLLLLSAFFSTSALALTPKHSYTVGLYIVSNSGQQTSVEQISASTDANGKLSFQFTNVPTTDTAPFLLVQIMDPATSPQLVRQTLVPAPTAGQHMEMGVSEASSLQTEVVLKTLAGDQTLKAMFSILMIPTGAIPTGAFRAADVGSLSQTADTAVTAFQDYLLQNGATSAEIASFENGLLVAMRDFAANSKTAVDQIDPVTGAGLYGAAGAQFLAAIFQACETAGIDPLLMSAAFDQAGQAMDNSSAFADLQAGEISTMQASYLADARLRRLFAQLDGYAAAMPVVGASSDQTQTLTAAASTLRAAMSLARQHFFEQAFPDPSILPDQTTIDQAVSARQSAMQSAFTAFDLDTTATPAQIDSMLTDMAYGMSGGTLSSADLTQLGFGTLQTTLDGPTRNWPIMMVAANNLMADVPAFRYLPLTSLIGTAPPLPALGQLPDSSYKSLLLLQYDLMLVHLIDLQTISGVTLPLTQGDLVSIDAADLANRAAIIGGMSGLTAAQIKALMAALSPPQLLF